MKYREIVSNAWDLTKNHKYLMWLAALPLAIELILATVYVPLRWGLYIVPDILTRTYNFVEQQYILHQMETTTVLLFIGFTFVLYLLVPTFCEGALIGTSAKVLHTGADKKIKKQFSIAYGLNVYLPLVELHAMTEMLNPLFVVLGMSLLEQFNYPLFKVLLIPALILFIIELIINFTLVYSKYELIIHESSILFSMKKSVKMVLFNVTETFFILILLFLIALRALVNMLIVFLIPVLLYAVATFLVSFFSHMIMYVVIIIGALFAYYYLLKTSSMLMMFITFVLVLTFTELSEKKDEIIVNEDSVIKKKIEEDKRVADGLNTPVAIPPGYVQQDALEIIGKSLLTEMERISKEKAREIPQSNVSYLTEGENTPALPVENQEIVSNCHYVENNTGVSKHTISEDITINPSEETNNTSTDPNIENQNPPQNHDNNLN